MKKFIAVLVFILTLFIITACSEDRSFSIDDVTIDADSQDVQVQRFWVGRA